MLDKTFGDPTRPHGTGQLHHPRDWGPRASERGLVRSPGPASQFTKKIVMSDLASHFRHSRSRQRHRRPASLEMLEHLQSRKGFSGLRRG
jgi:hypothetical protein